MPRGVGLIFQGIFVLFLALLAWRWTHNGLAWLVLYLPGAFFVARGLWIVAHDG